VGLQIRHEGGTLAYFQRYQNVAIDPDAMEWKEIFFTGGHTDKGEDYPGCFDDTFSYGHTEDGMIVWPRSTRRAGVGPSTALVWA